MMFRVLFIFVWFLYLDATEEIKVYLNTTKKFDSVYVGEIQCLDRSIKGELIQQLRSVLAFDFNYNGSMVVIPRAQEKEEKLQSKEGTFHLVDWKNWGVSYVLKGEVRNKILYFSLLSSNAGSLKQFSGIPLVGKLSIDRRKIHRVADLIYKSIYGREGIASSSILYSWREPNEHKRASEIWKCDWDGANAKSLTHEGSYAITPVSLPRQGKIEEERFLYVSYQLGHPKIFLYSPVKKESERVVYLNGNQLLPAFDLKGKRIAFISDATGKPALFLQPFDFETGEKGKPVHLFSYPRSTQASPTFSPDGSQLAFVSDKDGSPRIYRMTTNPLSSPVLVTKKNRENSSPCWSPDGKKLAYSAKTKGIRQIWVYDFDSGEERQLTHTPGNKENPSWAFNSEHVVFNSIDGAVSDLYLIHVEQLEAVRISHGPGIKHYPTWVSNEMKG